MSYEARTYEDTSTFDGESFPVVVIVVKGCHDTSRIVQALAYGNCEQGALARKIAASLRRHNSGRFALALLKRHGGADFTSDPVSVEGVEE
jgi:hypothetical protein